MSHVLQRADPHFADKPSATNAKDAPLSSTPAFTVSQIGSLQKGAPHPKSSSLWEFFTRASAHLSRMNNLDWSTI